MICRISFFKNISAIYHLSRKYLLYLPLPSTGKLHKSSGELLYYNLHIIQSYYLDGKFRIVILANKVYIACDIYSV